MPTQTFTSTTRGAVTVVWALVYTAFVAVFVAGRATLATAAALLAAASTVAAAVVWQRRRVTLLATPAVAGAVALQLTGTPSPATSATLLLVGVVAAGVVAVPTRQLLRQQRGTVGGPAELERPPS